VRVLAVRLGCAWIARLHMGASALPRRLPDMTTTIIPATDRHGADYGWLQTQWLLSFADYYDPANLQWGALRVYNDDRIAALTGFDLHGHRDMEIVTIVHAGAVSHADSMGNRTRITAGEVQRMTAGTGVRHSEHNRENEELHLHQIWFLPRRAGVAPGYAQERFDPAGRRNRLQAVVSGRGAPGALTMDSDATLSLCDLDAGARLPLPGAGHVFTYAFSGEGVFAGAAIAAGDQIRRRDAGLGDLIARTAMRLVVIEA
jgi:hypothetical protein